MACLSHRNHLYKLSILCPKRKVLKLRMGNPSCSLSAQIKWVCRPIGALMFHRSSPQRVVIKKRMIKSLHWFWALASISQILRRTLKSRNRSPKWRTSRCSFKMRTSSNKLYLRRKSNKKSLRIQSSRARWWTEVNPPSFSRTVMSKDRIKRRYWAQSKFRGAVDFAIIMRPTIVGGGRSNNSFTAKR